MFEHGRIYSSSWNFRFLIFVILTTRISQKISTYLCILFLFVTSVLNGTIFFWRFFISEEDKLQEMIYYSFIFIYLSIECSSIDLFIHLFHEEIRYKRILIYIYIKENYHTSINDLEIFKKVIHWFKMGSETCSGLWKYVLRDIISESDALRLTELTIIKS